MNEIELKERKLIARELLSAGRTILDDMADAGEDMEMVAPVAAALQAQLNIPFPAGLSPVPKEIVPKPSTGDALPQADVLVVTWTVAEQNALCDVLTPGFARVNWYRYSRRYVSHYDTLIRDTAPSKRFKILGTYFVTQIGDDTQIDKRKVLCFKSELHLNQDGIDLPATPGIATLPVKDMFEQLIAETGARLVITVGTAGGIDVRHDLGDVLVTRGAKFRLQDEFKNAPYKNQAYFSNWTVPTTHFAKAEELMGMFAKRLQEPDFGPPTKRYNFTGPLLKAKPNKPSIIHEQGTGEATRIPEFHPILTTDFFEFGTSANADDLLQTGCGLEMGDAVLGLVADGMTNPPDWLVIRNVSDPQINSDLPTGPGRELNMQSHWAVWYYESYGYWTSVNSALATWAVIAGR